MVQKIEKRVLKEGTMPTPPGQPGSMEGEDDRRFCLILTNPEILSLLESANLRDTRAILEGIVRGESPIGYKPGVFTRLFTDEATRAKLMDIMATKVPLLTSCDAGFDDDGDGEMSTDGEIICRMLTRDFWCAPAVEQAVRKTVKEWPIKQPIYYLPKELALLAFYIAKEANDASFGNEVLGSSCVETITTVASTASKFLAEVVVFRNQKR